MTTISIWSDIHCPFCWIGKHNLDLALLSLNLSTPEQQQAANVKIEWKSFQLNPNMPLEGYPKPFNYKANLAKEKGWTIERTTAIFQSVERQGKEVGCEFNFDRLTPVNSLRAHSIAKFLTAKSTAYNEAHAIEEDLFNLNFNKAIDFNNIAQVAQALAKYNITEDEIKEAYESEALKQQIAQDIAQSRQYGISGVPFFLINDKYAISGAQPPETFVKTLSQLVNTTPTTTTSAPSAQFPTCKPDGTCD